MGFFFQNDLILEQYNAFHNEYVRRYRSNKAENKRDISWYLTNKEWHQKDTKTNRRKW